jgi:radical SAM protein with 4Fe4S-binding SPASM domain
MSAYTQVRVISDPGPRLPLIGEIDLCYRCNSDCRHCWVRVPHDSPEQARELSFDEIKNLALDARAMGCREWRISGGEPMLRQDFPEIFDFLTRIASSYSINTNGTLITPDIAQLMKRPGSKMVALYGGTAEVCDNVMRTPGLFEATLRGMRCLKEAGAGFTVQIIPLRGNFHQLKLMLDIARSFSPSVRYGATWLYLSAYGDREKNREIKRQRLKPEQVLSLDLPDPSYEGYYEGDSMVCSRGVEHGSERDHLLAPCIADQEEFHVDPYGYLTFCSFIKDPALRYNIREGSFQHFWTEWLPGKTYSMPAQGEYQHNCKECEYRGECKWCPAYGYLEHRRPEAKVSYLCEVAKEVKQFKVNWLAKNRRHYQVAGLTLQVDSDLPFTDTTFDAKFKQFEVDKPGGDVISIRHHFALPEMNGKSLGDEVYRQEPWAVYKSGESWIYIGFSPDNPHEPVNKMAVFSGDHSRVRIHNINEAAFKTGGAHSLTLLPTDQILLARVLADRQGAFFHSCGVIMNAQGLLFIGHSGAGKSTLVKMLDGQGEILCDDRNIVRRWAEGFVLHGCWSHGEVAKVSAASAPLGAIFFLNQAPQNRIVRISDRREAVLKLLEHVIKPFVTADWWEKIIAVTEGLVDEVPCYNLFFDKSGGVVPVLQEFTTG